MKRRRTMEPSRHPGLAQSAAEAVMLQPHLMHTITSYQHGLFHDLAAIYQEWQATTADSDVFFVLNHEFVFLDPVTLHKLHTPVDHPRFLLHFPILTGNMALFHRWLACSGRDWVSPDTVVCAVHEGNLSLVQHLHQQVNVPCTTDALEAAAANGHLDIVKYIHNRTRDPCSWRVIYKAAEYGHMDVVQYLNECPHCRQFTKCALEYAAGLGHLAGATLMLQDASDGLCRAVGVDATHGSVVRREGRGPLRRFVELSDDVAMPTVEDSLDFLVDRMETHHGVIV